jgi:hypothetical protein
MDRPAYSPVQQIIVERSGALFFSFQDLELQQADGWFGHLRLRRHTLASFPPDSKRSTRAHESIEMWSWSTAPNTKYTTPTSNT